MWKVTNIIPHGKVSMEDKKAHLLWIVANRASWSCKCVQPPQGLSALLTIHATRVSQLQHAHNIKMCFAYEGQVAFNLWCYFEYYFPHFLSSPWNWVGKMGLIYDQDQESRCGTEHLRHTASIIGVLTLQPLPTVGLVKSTHEINWCREHSLTLSLTFEWITLVTQGNLSKTQPREHIDTHTLGRPPQFPRYYWANEIFA